MAARRGAQEACWSASLMRYSRRPVPPVRSSIARPLLAVYCGGFAALWRKDRRQAHLDTRHGRRGRTVSRATEGVSSTCALRDRQARDRAPEVLSRRRLPTSPTRHGAVDALATEKRLEDLRTRSTVRLCLDPFVFGADRS